MIVKWLFKQFIRFQVVMYRRSGGKRFGHLRGMPLLLLTTVGRKTGQQRATPVMYIRYGDNKVAHFTADHYLQVGYRKASP